MRVTPLLLLLVIGIAAFDECVPEPESYCFDETCGVEIYDEDVGVPCQCTEDNIGAKFTSCTSNERQLIYFWRPPATCLNGTLPDPVEHIPCDLQCAPGQHINLTTTPECVSCPAGTSSDGWGHLWDEWVHWPAQISTRCAIGDGKKCAGWQLDGETINSGDNHQNNYLQSTLTLNVKLVVPGWIAYSYMVSAEDNFDGMYIVIDDLSLQFVSNTRDRFQVANYSLSAGHHTIAWQYYKDRSITRGLDKAVIDWIQVMGTTYGYPSCEACPKGHYQSATGQAECIPCPAGTYGPTIGLTECPACDEGKFSYPGSISCQIQQHCVTLDPAYYTYDYSPCVNSQRTKTYRWIEPISCADPENATLPPPTTESCTVSCRAGEFVNADGQCEYCPMGSVSSGGTPLNCTQCEMGSVASNRTVHLDEWSSWPSSESISFRTGCDGTACYSSGWRLASQYIDSGLGHGKDSMPWVEMSIHGYNNGRMATNFTMMCQSGNEIVVSMDGYVIRTYQCDGVCEGSRKTFSMPLRAFDTSFNRTWTIRWTYMKNTNAVSTCDRIRIDHVDIVGVVGMGGSPACYSCPNGTSAIKPGMDHCEACPRGSSSLPDGDICLPCEGNTFADQDGMPCLECGAQTFVNTMHTQCDLSCSQITFTNATNNDTRIYDLTRIGQYNSTVNVVSNGTVQSWDVMGSICEWHPGCVDASGSPLDSYLCYETEFGWRNMGKVMSITELSNYTGLVLTYTEGLQFPFGFRGGLKCSSRLTLRCDPAVDMDGPIIEPGFNTSLIEPNCQINLLIKSRFACLKCTPEDLDIHETECINGKQMRFYSFKRMCSGGMELPDAEPVECTAEVVVKSNTVIILIVVIIIFFLGVVGGFGFLVWRNRQLYEKYSQLANRDVPMDEDIGSTSVTLDSN